MAVVVVARREDREARAFVARYAPAGARLLTPNDLSRAGWRHTLGDLGMASAVVGGRPLATREITGVIVRLPAVLEQDLSHIVPPDRAYVAAEMNAFLRFWLRELPCPVLNRPAQNGLAGPMWRHAQWVHAAARLGIPVLPSYRHIAFARTRTQRVDPPPGGASVTIVGDQHFGAVDQVLVGQARCLAGAAAVDLLTVHFSGAAPGARFVSANPWPDITPDDVADAILRYLKEPARRRS